MSKILRPDVLKAKFDLKKLKSNGLLNNYLIDCKKNLSKLPNLSNNVYLSGKFKLEEVHGDLFSVDESYSLAHCVSSDLVMAKGIAKIFKQKFNKLDELKSQNAKVGQVAYLKIENRFIFYLVTKDKYYQKPSYDTLKSSLIRMKEILDKNNITKLAIPHIGCGLDKLNWFKVKHLLIEVFKTSNLELKCFEF